MCACPPSALRLPLEWPRSLPCRVGWQFVYTAVSLVGSILGIVYIRGCGFQLLGLSTYTVRTNDDVRSRWWRFIALPIGLCGILSLSPVHSFLGLSIGHKFVQDAEWHGCGKCVLKRSVHHIGQNTFACTKSFNRSKRFDVVRGGFIFSITCFEDERSPIDIDPATLAMYSSMPDPLPLLQCFPCIHYYNFVYFPLQINDSARHDEASRWTQMVRPIL